MLDGSEFYVVLKLVSGEQVMAVLREEDDERILLESPMCIRTLPIFEMGRESVTASPLCQFTDDKMFVIHKKDIMFCKKMHQVFIPHYRRIVQDQEKHSFVPREPKSPTMDFHGEKITAEEALKRIQMLEELVDKATEPEQEEITFKNFVEGNDSIH